MAATPIRLAFRRTPVVGELAQLFIEYDGIGIGDLRIHQDGVPDLYRGAITTDCFLTIVAMNEKPIQAEFMFDGRAVSIGSPVHPFVPSPIMRRIRATRFCLPGHAINLSCESTGKSLTCELVKDQIIETKHSTNGSDRFIFRPTTAGWHIIRVTSHNFNVNTVATRRVFVGSLKPQITLDHDVQSEREGRLVSFTWKVAWADEVWIERDGKRKPMKRHDSCELRVPGETRLIAAGPGGTTVKVLRAVSWLFNDLLGGGHA